MLASNCDRPVVHEDVRLPERGGRDADILDVVVLGRVPAHVGVRPFLLQRSAVGLSHDKGTVVALQGTC